MAMEEGAVRPAQPIEKLRRRPGGGFIGSLRVGRDTRFFHFHALKWQPTPMFPAWESRVMGAVGVLWGHATDVT